MKSKLAIVIIVMILGLLMSRSALAQTNVSAADPGAPGGGAVVTSATAPATDTNTPAAGAVVSPTSAPGAEATTVAAAGTNLANVVVPLIEFHDVQLTVAIDNLARQAGINYIIDPKVGFGQVDERGQVRAEPKINIRWENVTAGDALGALLNNYTLQLVEDPKTRVARITIKDPAAPPPLLTKIVQLKYAAPTNIVTAVQTVFTDRRSKVVPDVRTSQLVLSATEPELDAVDALVARLDTITRQVLIEAQLLETSKNPTTAKGIDWSGTLSGQNISFGNGVVQPATTTFQAPGDPTTTTLPGGRTVTTTPDWTAKTTTGGTQGGTTGGSTGGSLAGTAGSVLSGGLIPNGFSANTLSGITPSIGFLNADGLHAVLSFLNSDADAQVLSTPRAVTLDNMEATLMVSRAFPIFLTTAGTQGSPGGSQVNYTNIGTILHVTPRISANDFIDLRVKPEVSSLAGTLTKIVAGVANQADMFDMRTINTEVMSPSGNTLVLGGLISDNSNAGYTKVPLLGDIPLLGWAFRSENKNQLKKNLLIFITPTIVRDADFQPTKTDFLQTRPTTGMGRVDADPIWDSAKPRDWSNPNPIPYEDANFNEKLVQPPSATPSAK